MFLGYQYKYFKYVYRELRERYGSFITNRMTLELISKFAFENIDKIKIVDLIDQTEFNMKMEEKKNLNDKQTGSNE